MAAGDWRHAGRPRRCTGRPVLREAQGFQVADEAHPGHWHGHGPSQRQGTRTHRGGQASEAACYSVADDGSSVNRCGHLGQDHGVGAHDPHRGRESRKCSRWTPGPEPVHLANHSSAASAHGPGGRGRQGDWSAPWQWNRAGEVRGGTTTSGHSRCARGSTTGGSSTTTATEPR